MSGLIDRLALRVAESSNGPSVRSRRWLLGRISKVAGGSAAALTLSSLTVDGALAGYSTYVVQNNSPCRSGPGTFYSLVRTFNCGNSIFVNEVTGSYACGCNECTDRWAQVKISPTGSVCYIHRGNLNPYNGGACECP